MAIDIVARAIAASKANLENGKVPASELPSYVDDVEEYEDLAHFPATGEEGKIYVALDTSYTYRWTGTEYVYIGMTDIDDEMSDTSTNPVQNKVVKGAIDSIATYRPFNPSWPTTTTLLALCQAVEADQEAVVGMEYLGEVACSGLPFTGNAELSIAVMSKSGSSKVLRLQLSSANVSPYHWEATYWVGSVTDWRSFVPYDLIGVVSVSDSAESGTLTASQVAELQKSVSFIARGSETFVKAGVVENGLLFNSTCLERTETDINDGEIVEDSNVIGEDELTNHRITVNTSTREWVYSE